MTTPRVGAGGGLRQPTDEDIVGLNEHNVDELREKVARMRKDMPDKKSNEVAYNEHLQKIEFDEARIKLWEKKNKEHAGSRR